MTNALRRELKTTCKAVFLLASLALNGNASPVELVSGASPAAIYTVAVKLEVEGDVKVEKEREVRSLPLKAEGALLYREKLLDVSADNHAALKSIRDYQTATAKLSVDGIQQTPELGEDRRTIIAKIDSAARTLYSPLGPLSRQELDVIDVPGDSLIVDRLLPEKQVEAGDRWSHSGDVLAPLLGIEAVSRADVESTLVSIDGVTAKMAFSGSVSGAVGGVNSEIEVLGKYHFDTNLRRVSWFAMVLKENRSIGHASPGLEVVARLTMKVARASDKAIAEFEALPAELESSSTETWLSFQPQSGGYQILHDRRWHVMQDDSKITVMRLVDRGDLVAQCNISLLGELSSDQPMTLERFQREVEQALGEHFRQFVTASQSMTEDFHQVFRVVATGEVDKLPIQWDYYHVADLNGRRVGCVFTVEPNLAEKLGDAPQAMVQSLRFTDAAAVQSASGELSRIH